MKRTEIVGSIVLRLTYLTDEGLDKVRKYIINLQKKREDG